MLSVVTASILQAHHEQYPAMRAQDVYKLIFQAICGAEHIVQSAHAFERNLRTEYESVGADASEPLVMPLRADGLLARLNLRPYKARKGSLTALVEECLRAAASVDTSAREASITHWRAFVIECRNGLWLTHSSAELDELDAWLVQNDYPAVHHSEVYRQAYQPAYRLVRTAPAL